LEYSAVCVVDGTGKIVREGKVASEPEALIGWFGSLSVREALYQGAHVIMTKPLKDCSQLKSWAMRIARRAGMSKAKVALARKLAVIMHRMLANGTPFNAAAAAA
jgi:transposase